MKSKQILAGLRAIRDVLHAALALLLLQLERDAAHRTLLNALHEMPNAELSNARLYQDKYAVIYTQIYLKSW